MNSNFLIYFICLFLLVMSPNMEQKAVSGDGQEHIASEIIRLHVIANSDTKEDQNLKILVKNEIVSYLREKMNGTESIEEAREIIQDNLSAIEEIAANKMAMEGYSYGVKASLTYCDFPIKQYGDLTFPAGRYEALRVQLGTSEGKNWWCVMYPSLCYVDETRQEITEENKEQFKKF